MFKLFIKLHMILTILYILGLSLMIAVYFFGDNMSFLASTPINQELAQAWVPNMVRIWVANLGLSSFMAVFAYAKEEEFEFITKTALLTFGFNLLYAVILIFILRKLLKKPGLSPIGGF